MRLEAIGVGIKGNGYKWGQRLGRALLELTGAREVIKEMDRQEAKRRKSQVKRKDGK